MPLTTNERLLLANQYKILAALDEANAEDYINKKEIAEHGYEGLYHELFSSIGDPVTNDICTETHDILTMYRVITPVIDHLPAAEAQRLNVDRIRYQGFDLNNDRHYGFMRFIIQNMELYEEREVINSHTVASLGMYRRMLPVYNQYMEAHNYTFGPQGLEAIVRAAFP